MYDVIIIGAGVTGSAVARELSRYKLAVASAGDDHVETLGKIAGNCSTEEEVEEILKMSVDQIYELFA